MSEPYLDIEQIYFESVQGNSLVYKCRAENNEKYWVKGHHVGRLDQIREWLCGHLADSFGLPIAPFCIVSIDEAFHREFSDEFKHIGYGPMFASKDVGEAAMWFGHVGQPELVPDALKRDLLLFDHWIHNSDRETYNPNLLWNASEKALVVIDHNLAFDEDYDEQALSSDHIFSKVDRTPFRDMNQRCQFMDRMDQAIKDMEAKIHEIPEQWYWADLEQTRRTDLHLNAWISILKRYQTLENESFWSVL